MLFTKHIFTIASLIGAAGTLSYAFAGKEAALIVMVLHTLGNVLGAIALRFHIENSAAPARLQTVYCAMSAIGSLMWLTGSMSYLLFAINVIFCMVSFSCAVRTEIYSDKIKMIGALALLLSLTGTMVFNLFPSIARFAFIFWFASTSMMMLYAFSIKQKDIFRGNAVYLFSDSIGLMLRF